MATSLPDVLLIESMLAYVVQSRRNNPSNAAHCRGYKMKRKVSLIELVFFFVLYSCLQVVSPFIVRTAWRRSSLLSHPRGVCYTSTKDDVSEVTASPDMQLDMAAAASVPKKRESLTMRGVSNTKATKNVADADGDSKSRKSKRKKRKKLEEPFYWRNETDKFVLKDQHWAAATPEDEAHMIRFQVRGNPRPLRRHRTAKGFMYNPSSAYQESFRKVVHDMVWADVEKELDNHQPLFLEEHQLVVRLVFRMKRPKNHFVSGKPGPGRLRQVAPPRLAPTRTDVDNLAKFVLDSLNGLLYVDDRQVASIQATKLFDNDGHCEGSTEVFIQRLSEEDVDELLLSHIPPTG